MPTRPLSHEARQYHKRVQTAVGKTQRQDINTDYAQRRQQLHGPDPRSTARWQRLRLMVLNRDPLCADPFRQHSGLPALATEVDHVRPLWEARDLAFDESNLQPLCVACHNMKSAQERRGLADVWLICGPPGAGKSTYVRQHMLPGDMVVDWDRLMEALTWRAVGAGREWTSTTERFPRYVWAAYDGVIEAMAQHLSQAKRGMEKREQPLTWVLGTLADRHRRRTLAERIGARCLVLEVSAPICLNQIAGDSQRLHDVERWAPLVEDWWARYEPDAADNVVKVPAMD